MIKNDIKITASRIANGVYHLRYIIITEEENVLGTAQIDNMFSTSKPDSLLYTLWFNYCFPTLHSLDQNCNDPVDSADYCSPTFCTKPRFLLKILVHYYVHTLLRREVYHYPQSSQNILKFLLKNLKLDTVLLGNTLGVLGTVFLDLSFGDVGDGGVVLLSSLINKGFNGMCLSASRLISRTVSRKTFSTSLNSPAAETSWNEHAYWAANELPSNLLTCLKWKDKGI